MNKNNKFKDIVEETFLADNVHNLLLASENEVKRTILLVDDEENNLKLLVRTLRNEYEIMTALNGKEALEIVSQHGDNISLIISDQKMPEMQGTEFFKNISDYPDIVRILLTGHSDTEIIIQSINECNLFQYIMKPFEPEELKVAIRNGLKKQELTSNNTAMLKDLKELFYKTIKSIASTLDAKDPYTHGHSFRVTLYSLILASELDLESDVLEEIEIAGLLHDIGKIGIPQNILCKPGKLTDEEFEIMQSHSVQGEKMIANIKKLTVISNWLRTHHERWDGRGYPNGLKGEEIPISARIIALADTYDAMTSTRSYRKALPHQDAINEIQKCAGSQFDPNIAMIFVKAEEKFLLAKEDPDLHYPKYSYLENFMRKPITV